MANVLLIEPNQVLAKTYAQALTHAGFKVTRVSGAQAAITAADSQTPDIVVIELQLPVHNGVEFLQEFRSYTEWQAVPVVVNTLLSPNNLAAGRKALSHDFGVTSINYKPGISLQDLVRLVRDNLQAAK